MSSERKLRRKIESTQELLGVVKTMKSLAAVNARQYEGIVEATARYTETVELGLHLLLHRRPELAVSNDRAGEGETGMIFVASEQGMCGRFNEDLLAEVRGRAPVVDRFLAVGWRGAQLLRAQSHRVDESFDLPATAQNLGARVHDVLIAIEHWRRTRSLRTILLGYNRPGTDRPYAPHVGVLYPLDHAWLRELAVRPWPERVIPMFSMPVTALFASLIRNHLFARLHQTLSESLISENRARFSAMQSAEDNITERKDRMWQQYHRLRKQAITEELRDIVFGSKLLRDQDEG